VRSSGLMAIILVLSHLGLTWDCYYIYVWFKRFSMLTT